MNPRVTWFGCWCLGSCLCPLVGHLLGSQPCLWEHKASLPSFVLKTNCCQMLEAFCGLSVAPGEQEIEGLLLDLLPQMHYFCLIIVLVKGRR